NALVPYALYAVGLGIAPRAPRTPLSADELIERLDNTVAAITAGLPKVTSDTGCHELRGYGRSFSSIGLGAAVAEAFGTPNYFCSETIGATWETIRADAAARASELRGETPNKLENPDRFYPKMWKRVEDIALGEATLDDYTAELLELEQKQPVAIRHLLGLKPAVEQPSPDSVDISIRDHAMPVVIGAMSFGSQGELSYKAYAEAAHRLNILCIN